MSQAPDDKAFAESFSEPEKTSEVVKDVAYWMSRSVGERISEIERLRMIAYPGYDPATSRMERVLEIVNLKDLREGK